MKTVIIDLEKQKFASLFFLLAKAFLIIKEGLKMNQECTNCNSENTVKCGKRKNQYHYVQIRYCKGCYTKFTVRQFKRIVHDSETVGEALELYFRGMSLRAISDFLLKQKNIKVSHSTILHYLRKGILQVKEFTDELVPQTGKVLLADETMINLQEAHRNKAWVWNIMDEDSRFILNNHVSFTRTQYHANTAMKTAANFTNGETEEVITDGLPHYSKAIKYAFKNAKHSAYLSIKLTPNNNVIERYHGDFKARHKPMRKFSKIKSTQILMWGWQIYHNYIRPHGRFKGNTPANIARVGLPDQLSWRKLLELSQENKVLVA